MLAVLLAVMLAVPIVELYVIVQVAQWLEVGPTLALLVLISVAGAWLVKQQGLATWRRLQATLARGEMPTTELTDGALILFGGALLLTPGFITDAAGLLLLLPPTRAALRRTSAKLLRFLALRRFGLAGEVGRRVYTARAGNARRRAANEKARGSAAPPAEPREPLPSAPDRPGEDGSRDTA